MLSSSLFRRNFLLLTVFVAIFVVLGGVLNWVYRDLQRDKIRHLRPFPVLIASLLNEMHDNPVVAVEKAMSSDKVSERENIDIIGKDGKSLRSGEQLLSEPLSDEDLDQLANEQPVMRSNRGDHPSTVVATKKTDQFFLIVPKHGRRPPPPPPMLWPFVSLMISVMIGVGVALYIMSLGYKRKSEEALRVLTAIRNGNLGARLNTQGLKELEPIVNSFNAMADEVSSLVESLQHTDSARRRLLQDLAHDLRTPLTSVKSFLETLKNSSDKISVERRVEAINYCVSEVNYFSDLVEDLLFLANISEPRYVLASDQINVLAQLQDVVTLFQAQYPNKNIIHEINTAGSIQLLGSQKLFERLLRNVFSNAVSFCRSQIVVQLHKQDHSFVIRVVDDGPGFSEEALNTFGIKKASRQIFKEEEGSRISLGIGSLIMKEIVMVHRGTLTHKNNVVDGQIKGAIIEITLPAI